MFLSASWRRRFSSILLDVWLLSLEHISGAIASWRRTLVLLLCTVGALPLWASRLVVDGAGHSITVPDHAVRIVSLAPSVTDDLFEIGAGAQVVAISDFTRYPAQATLKPSIGSPGSPSLERILALHPDLVIGTAGINSPDTLRQLQQHGMTVFMVNPIGIAGLYSSLGQIGAAIGRQAQAALLVRSLWQREQALRRPGEHRTAISVFVPLWYDPVITIGKPAYITQLLAIIGLHSVTDDIAQAWPTVSLEAVLKRQPDRLLLIDGSGVSLNRLSTLPGWSTLRAVRARNALHVDDRIELPSPVCFDALAALAQQLPVNP